MKQDKENINLTLSQLIQLNSFAYSRQPLLQRQASEFMKALFLFDQRKWLDEQKGKIDIIMFLIRELGIETGKSCEAIKRLRQKQGKGYEK